MLDACARAAQFKVERALRTTTNVKRSYLHYSEHQKYREIYDFMYMLHYIINNA